MKYELVYFDNDKEITEKDPEGYFFKKAEAKYREYQADGEISGDGSFTLFVGDKSYNSFFIDGADFEEIKSNDSYFEVGGYYECITQEAQEAAEECGMPVSQLDVDEYTVSDDDFGKCVIKYNCEEVSVPIKAKVNYSVYCA